MIEIIIVLINIINLQEVEILMEKVFQYFGKIDILVNVVGVGIFK